MVGVGEYIHGTPGRLQTGLRSRIPIIQDWELFSKNTVSGLTGWWKSDIGVTADGLNRVSAWADQSGNNFTLVQGTDGLKPIYTSGVQGGLPALVFDGSDDYMRVTFALSQPFTVIIAGRLSSNDASDRFLMAGSGSLTILEAFSQTYRMFANGTVATGNIRSTNNTIWCMRFNGVSSDISANSTVVSGDAGGNAFSQITLCDNDGLGGYYAPLNCYEILIYNKKLSDIEKTVVYNYINQKFALGV